MNAPVSPPRDALQMFIPITKVDEAKRLVYGVATAERPDRSDEICDYASTKPFFQAWSSEIEKTTAALGLPDGKSLGNVRAMHGNIAAGKVTELNFDDDEKRIEVVTKIVDDAEWQKVIQGVYTGFSQGGRYVRRWKDDGDGKLTRYTADPSEISIVDLPCLPDATFSFVKMGDAGAEVIEKRHFKSASLEDVSHEPTHEEVEAKAKELAGDEEVNESHRKDATAALLAKEPNDPPIVEHADKAAGVDPDELTPEKHQFWDCGCVEHRHMKKAEAKACKRGRRVAEAAKAATASVDEKLAAIAATLGISAEDLQSTGDDAYWKREFTQEQRDKAAESGDAMSDGSFPIKTKADLENAIKAIGRAKDPEKARAHIVARAKDLDATDMLPADWSGSTKDKEDKAAAVDDLAKEADAATGVDYCATHAGMAKFHATHATGDNAEMHKAASGAHAEAFMAHATGAEDKMAKSDNAFDATRKCYGMGKVVVSDEAWPEIRRIIEAGPSEIGKALRPRVTAKLGKDLGTVGRLAFLLSELNSICECVEFEEAMEDDAASPLPAMMEDAVKNVSAILVAMAQEESRELLEDKDYDAGSPIGMAMAAMPVHHGSALVKFLNEAADLKKAAASFAPITTDSLSVLEKAVEGLRAEKIGARNSSADKARLQKAHDLLKDLGADCGTMAGGAKGTEATDLLKGRLDDLAEENAVLKATVSGYAPKLDAVLAKLAKIEAQPMPAKASLRAVTKDADRAAGGLQAPSTEDFLAEMEKMSPDERALVLTKMSLRRPMPVNG